MAYDKRKVIEIALAEVNYLEKETNAQLDDKTANAGDANYTKYARDLDAINFYNGRKQGHYWCDVFVDWCFYKAYGKTAALKITYQPTNNKNNCGAGCKWSRQYYQNKGQLFDVPQSGDQIFFWSSDKKQVQHTGLVYDVDSTYVYTVEGNTTGGQEIAANGGGVFKKKYKRSLDRIAGYGRPNYGSQDAFQESSQEAVKPPQTAPEVQVTEYTTHTVKAGDRLWNIARKYLGKGTLYTEIMKLNGLTSSNLKVGQVLKVAPKKSETSAAATYTTYTVKKGDTLWDIAGMKLGNPRRYPEIMKASGLKSDALNIGQKLKIPKA